MIDNVQLKQSSVVDGEQVLEDINPKSSTNAIVDPSTGAQLNETLERIWNALNEKISRVVNSINNKTGVVVLDPSDVGLDKVDNISFADIKKWVIDELTRQFGNKRLKLLNSYDELNEIILGNDKNNANAPFFVERWSDLDTRSHIGYFYINTETDTLSYAEKPINTIGGVDQSLNYVGGNLSVNLSSYEDALQVLNEYTGDQNGLWIDKSKICGNLYFFNGLYGDTGLGTDADNALLRLSNEQSTSYPDCTIYVNNTIINPGYGKRICLNKSNLKVGDIIITQFNDYKVPSGKYSLREYSSCNHYIGIDFHLGMGYDVDELIYVRRRALVTDPYVDVAVFRVESVEPTEGYVTGVHLVRSNANNIDQCVHGDSVQTWKKHGSEYEVGSVLLTIDQSDWVPQTYKTNPNVNELLCNRNPGIGIVTKAPTLVNPDEEFEIRFYTIATKSLYGLMNHNPTGSVADPVTHKDKLNIELVKGVLPYFNGLSESLSDCSGLCINEKWSEQSVPYNDGNAEIYVVTPRGPERFAYTPDDSTGGLRILTDHSLCIEDCTDWRDANGDITDENDRTESVASRNWSAPLPTQGPGISRGSYLGINLLKAQYPTDVSTDYGTFPLEFLNLSGLRIVSFPDERYDKELTGAIDESEPNGWDRELVWVVFNSVTGMMEVYDYLDHPQVVYSYNVLDTKPEDWDGHEERYFVPRREDDDPLKPYIVPLQFIPVPHGELWAPNWYYERTEEPSNPGTKIVPRMGVWYNNLNSETLGDVKYLYWDGYEYKINSTKGPLQTNGYLNRKPKLSGGLAINVGQYLCIAPGVLPGTAADYYDSGKVNVRVGRGLHCDETNSNRIGIHLADPVYHSNIVNPFNTSQRCKMDNALRFDTRDALGDITDIDDSEVTPNKIDGVGVYAHAHGGITVDSNSLLRLNTLPQAEPSSPLRLTTEALLLDKHGHIRVPLDINGGLRQTWESDSENLTPSIDPGKGGLRIKLKEENSGLNVSDAGLSVSIPDGCGLTFDENGKLTIDIDTLKTLLGI